MVNFLVSDSLKKTQRDSLLSLILSRFLLAQQDQQRFDCLIKVFFDKLSEKQFQKVTDEVIDKFTNSGEDFDIDAYRNLFQMIIQIITKQPQESKNLKMVLEEGYFKQAQNQERQAIIASNIASIIKIMDIKSNC